MPEKHLRQLGFTYRACKPFIKKKKRIQNLKKQETEDMFIKNLLSPWHDLSGFQRST